MSHLVADEIRIFHRPGQPLCAIIPAHETVPSQPGPSTAATTEVPSGGRNKYAKGNDGTRVSKTVTRDKGKGKAKEKEKEPVEEVDWEPLLN
jgi:hypothetical protein